MILVRSADEMMDGTLYHVEADKTLRIIPPACDWRKIFDNVHSGLFGTHLREAKIHGQIGKHYRWPRMRADIVSWCRGC